MHICLFSGFCSSGAPEKICRNLPKNFSCKILLPIAFFRRLYHNRRRVSNFQGIKAFTSSSATAALLPDFRGGWTLLNDVWRQVVIVGKVPKETQGGKKTVNLSQETLETFAYEELKNAIVTGVYPPGSQIIEETIAAQLNMSRSPVRIAIKQLEAEGFLEKYPNKRIYVARGDTKRTINVLHVREALEGMAARLAARNRDEQDLERIRFLMREMDECVEKGSILQAYRSGFRMHYAFFEAAKNPDLRRLAALVLEQESVFSYRSLQQDTRRVQASQKEHAEIAAAIFSQNEDEAEDLARAHIRKLIQRSENLAAQEEEAQRQSILGGLWEKV